MNSLDFFSGLDFTGLPSISGADIDNGIAQCTPLLDTDETVGKGMPIITTDSAANIPVVPDPTAGIGFTKWKRYPWIRRPFAGQTDKSPRIYLWNDDAASDVILLKWVALSVDLTTLTNLANNALATSDNAVAIASVANNTANTANNTANTANANALAAGVTAAAAVTTANTANITAAAASVVANGANVNAATALFNSTTPADIQTRLLPSVVGYQKIRTKQDVSTVEWFSEKDNYVKLTEVYAKGVDNPVGVGTGINTRILNNIDNNSGGLLSLNTVTGIMTFNVAGVYRINAFAIINRSGSSANSYQLVIANNVTNVTLLTGTSGHLLNGNTNNQIAFISGLITVAAADTIRFDMYLSSAVGITMGLASNVHPDAGGKEVYSGMELTFIGV